jgi:hypothetical protein
MDAFKKLCGNDVFSNVRLVTTGWDLLKEQDDGERAEKELRDNYWKGFLDNGSQMHRFQYTCSSAWEVINSLPMNRTVVQIQREMVDEEKTFFETTMGRSLLAWVSEVFKDLIVLFERLVEKAKQSKRRPPDSSPSVNASDLRPDSRLSIAMTLGNDSGISGSPHSGSPPSPPTRTPWAVVSKKYPDKQGNFVRGIFSRRGTGRRSSLIAPLQMTQSEAIDSQTTLCDAIPETKVVEAALRAIEPFSVSVLYS